MYLVFVIPLIVMKLSLYMTVSTAPSFNTKFGYFNLLSMIIIEKNNVALVIFL